MAIIGIKDLKSALKPGFRLLGIDHGGRRVGLAISDPGLTVASPLEVLEGQKFTQVARTIADLATSHTVGGAVIGLPLNMDGSEGPRCQSVRDFAFRLQQHLGEDFVIAFWDERLSSNAIGRILIDEADMSRKRRGEVIDKMAAGYILQGALDSLRA